MAVTDDFREFVLEQLRPSGRVTSRAMFGGIGLYLDGLFFVVRAGKTSMRFAKMGINTIHQRGAPILGLIVNGVPIDNPYYYYTTYYYSSYYHRPLSPDENAFPERRGALPEGQPGAPGVDLPPTERK